MCLLVIPFFPTIKKNQTSQTNNKIFGTSFRKSFRCEERLQQMLKTEYDTLEAGFFVRSAECNNEHHRGEFSPQKVLWLLGTIEVTDHFDHADL